MEEMMTTVELVHGLELLANDESCDGSCDESLPYRKCPLCRAREVLNEVDAALRGAWKEIQA